MSVQITERAWTSPFHGVTHRMVHGRQCTIEVHGACITATVFGRRGSGQVQADAITAPVTFATVDAAQTWCVRTATPYQQRTADTGYEDTGRA